MSIVVGIIADTVKKKRPQGIPVNRPIGFMGYTEPEPSRHSHEEIDNILDKVEGVDELEDDFIRIAGYSPSEAAEAAINVLDYDLMD
jgi:hypothetical protein